MNGVVGLCKQNQTLKSTASSGAGSGLGIGNSASRVLLSLRNGACVVMDAGRLGPGTSSLGSGISPLLASGGDASSSSSSSSTASAAPVEWASQPGHSETIFDIAFHPRDPNVFATSGYDGYVKLWRLNDSAAGDGDNSKSNGSSNSIDSQHRSYRELQVGGDDKIIYSVAFGGADGELLGCTTSSGDLVVWALDGTTCDLAYRAPPGLQFCTTPIIQI